MRDQPRLQTALSELAALLLGDFLVADVLGCLSTHALQVLPALGVGVSFDFTGRFHAVWSAGVGGRDISELQAAVREHRDQAAMVDGRPAQAVIPGQRPVDGDRGTAAIGTVLSLPLHARGRTWGVLDVYRGPESRFSEQEVRAGQVLAQAGTAYLLTAWDRREQRLDQDRLRLQALHDPLTGLPNRLLLVDRLRHALAGVARQPDSVGLLFLDLDGFKQVNDAYGHEAGDRLLIAVSQRLEQALRPGDTLCRLGGDEFVVLCENLQAGSADLLQIGQRLLAALHEPVSSTSGQVPVSVSAGAVLARADDLPETVIRDADAAMYAAKRRRGGGVVVLAAREAVSRPVRVAPVAEVEGAWERGELRVFYQPVVSLPARRRLGLEALLRWEHPVRGLLTAADFLPALEDAGLAAPVGLWVLREAGVRLGSLAAVRDTRHCFVAVNVSAQQLRHPGFTGQLKQIVADTGVDPTRVMLDIAGSLAAQGGGSLAVLRELAETGVRIAIDNFGTDCYPVADLAHLPADTLKIDRMLIAALGRTLRDDAVVRGTMALARELGMQVIAEGVETTDQHDLLVAAGCEAAQGQLYGAPHPWAT